MKQKDVFDAFAGEFKPTEELEEELGQEDLDPKKVEEEHFEETDE